MSLQDVEKKVLASAESEAGEILEKAQADAKAELERRGSTLRDEQQRTIAAGKADADAALERDVTTRRADHGMAILRAKNDILDAIFARAQERILASEDLDYSGWLGRQVRLAADTGAGILHCNERDRGVVQAALAETGTDRVALADEPAPLAGGVLLVGDAFDLDLTLEAALGDLREEHTITLAGRLFAQVPTLAGTQAPADEGGDAPASAEGD